MRLEDFQKKTFNSFSGLWSRGKDDECPPDHFSDCLNIDWNLDEIKTRPGIFPSIYLGYGAGNGKVRRFAGFFDPTIGSIILILDEAGNLYTYSGRSGDDAVTPRLTEANATDFSAIKMLGRIYIAFHNGESGLFGVNLKVFIPGVTPALDEFRDAGGLAPINSAIGAADTVAAGVVNAGTYKIAVSYVTTSGFVTQPGPKIAGVFTATSHTAAGSKKIDLSNLPVGPSGTAQRQILITKAGLEEYFFLSSAFGGLIDNNVDTTVTINFDDTTDLVDSADYLFDLLETIPTALVLQDYNERLVLGGIAVDPSILRISYPGEPEAFDAIDGIVNVTKDDGFTIRNSMVIRNSLYVWKNLGLFSLNDNGDVPSTWGKAVPIDLTVNASIHGIAEFFDTSGIRLARDWTLAADRSGIVLFDGIVRKPPITDKINDIWQRINYHQYHKLVLAVDEQHHKIYCAVPIDFATDNNTLLVGDYNSCPGKIPEFSRIKWTKWVFNPCNSFKSPTEIGLFGYPPDTVPTLKIASVDGGGKIWSINPYVGDDVGTDIESYFQTSLLFWEGGYVHFFTAARLRVIGDGTILCTIAGEDDVLTANLPNILLSSGLLSSFRFFSDVFIGDGVTTQFTLCNTPANSFIAGFQNGLLIKKGTDFTVVGNTITMTVAPLIGDTLQFIFQFGTPLTIFTLETPIGVVDGSNPTFTLSNIPADAYVAGFQNGLLIKSGVDFTRVNNIVTMTVPPFIGDTLQFLFHPDSLELGFILETPPEAIDGANTIYSTTSTPSNNYVLAFQNGLALRYIIDYFYNGSKVIFYRAPSVGDNLQFLFRSSGVSTRVLGQERLIRFNFQNEKARLKFRMTAGRFILNKIECFGKPVYEMRPT